MQSSWCFALILVLELGLGRLYQRQPDIVTRNVGLCFSHREKKLRELRVLNVGRAIAKAVNCQLLTSMARVRFHVSPCGICGDVGGKVDTQRFLILEYLSITCKT